MELRKVIVTPDGKTFDTMAEAQSYMRRPKIKEALVKATGGNAELADWLLDHQEQVEVAFETGTIKRVTKSESKKLADALAYIAETLAGDKKAAFVVDNVDAVKDSFRWPSVKRMDEAEKAHAARNSLVAASEGNEELATWIIENKTAVLEAFEAGVKEYVASVTAAPAASNGPTGSSASGAPSQIPHAGHMPVV